MAWWRRLFGRKMTAAQEALWREMFGVTPSKAGVSVTYGTALQASAVLACVRVISEGIAQLPLKLYREREDGGKDLAKDHPLYPILYRRPNEWQTSFEFRELLTMHAVLTGNGYAFKNVLSSGRLAELIPLLPNRVKVTQSEDYELSYELKNDNGTTTPLRREQVVHLRGPSWNGYLGLEPVRVARDAIGLSLALEEHSARLHSNGARPGGVLSTEQHLKPEQVKEIREAWERAQGGVENAYKTALMTGGMKWISMAMSGVDAQTLEQRKMQIEEICRHFRVFPQMVMQSDKTSTFASAESFFLAHVVHTLGPWIERWEAVLERDLLSDRDIADGVFAKFNVNGLMRGAAKDRAEYYSKALGAGGSPAWMTPNDIRTLEDLNPIEGGNELPKPTNPGTGDQPPAA